MMVTRILRMRNRLGGFGGVVMMLAPVRANRNGSRLLRRYAGLGVTMTFAVDHMQPSGSVTENDHAAQQASENGSEQRRHQKTFD